MSLQTAAAAVDTALAGVKSALESEVSGTYTQRYAAALNYALADAFHNAHEVLAKSGVTISRLGVSSNPLPAGVLATAVAALKAALATFVAEAAVADLIVDDYRPDYVGRSVQAIGYAVSTWPKQWRIYSGIAVHGSFRPGTLEAAVVPIDNQLQIRLTPGFTGGPNTDPYGHVPNQPQP